MIVRCHLEKCFIAFTIVDLDSIVVDGATFECIDKDVPEKTAVTINTDAVNGRDVIETVVSNSESSWVVDAMAETKVGMDVLIKAFGVRQKRSIPFFVLVGGCASILGDSVAEVLFARWAEVAESKVFTVYGNEAVRQVELVNLVVGKSSRELKWLKVVASEVDIGSVQLGMASLRFRDKVGNDAGMVRDGRLSMTGSLSVSIDFCILVKFGHELHEMGGSDLVGGYSRRILGLLLRVSNNYREWSVSVVSEVEVVKWNLCIEEESLNGKVDV